MGLRIFGSKKEEDFQQNNAQKIVSCLCQCCDGIPIKEKWIWDEGTTLYHRIPSESDDESYVRVVFGIDPLYIDDSRPCVIPEGQSIIYFCRDCEEKNRIFDTLIAETKKVTGQKRYDEGIDQSQFIPGKGYWITANCYRKGQEDGYFNIQINRADFEQMLFNLKQSFSGTNPFGISEL
jgi:hypothetical protein